jgi:hypothetical protein
MNRRANKRLRKIAKPITQSVINPIKKKVKVIDKRVKLASKGPRKTIPTKVKNWLNKYGDKKITKIIIGRTPINKNITKLFNLLTFGKVRKMLNKMGHDEFFHLYSYIYLNDNTIHRLEKNEVVRINKLTKYKPEKEDKTIIVNKDLKLMDYVNNGEKVLGKKTWIYNAKTANCQDFQIGMLKGSGLLTNELDTFIKQETHKIFAKTPKYINKLSKFSTDAVNVIDILTQG